jgi:ABC-type spermidine/putrescine transport system permease subunit I
MIGNIAASQFGAAVNWPFGDAIGVVMVLIVFLALALPVLLWRLPPKVRRGLSSRRERLAAPAIVGDTSG